MLSCQQTHELVTQADHQPLSLRQRLAVRLHLALCRLCRRYARQSDFIRQASSRLFARHPRWRLSPEARQRIQQRLDQQAQ